jgi:hypothetical protein
VTRRVGKELLVDVVVLVDVFEAVDVGESTSPLIARYLAS